MAWEDIEKLAQRFAAVMETTPEIALGEAMRALFQKNGLPTPSILTKPPYAEPEPTAKRGLPIIRVRDCFRTKP
jgi:hypothetical protein